MKWSDAEVAALVQMRLAGRNWPYICKQFKRNKPTCAVKYNATLRAMRYEGRGRVMLAGKQQSRTDLTGIICGDPAPGRSALDGVLHHEPRRPISLAPISMGASA